MEKFAHLLLEWYEENKRNFPWRKTRDPYKILLAEIMLQRTKAKQVQPVYLSFLKRFPELETLNSAKPGEIEEFISKLGLMWRANLIRRLAKELIKKFDGKIPETRNTLISLPAVGE